MQYFHIKLDTKYFEYTQYGNGNIILWSYPVEKWIQMQKLYQKETMLVECYIRGCLVLMTYVDSGGQ